MLLVCSPLCGCLHRDSNYIRRPPPGLKIDSTCFESWKARNIIGEGRWTVCVCHQTSREGEFRNILYLSSIASVTTELVSLSTKYEEEVESVRTLKHETWRMCWIRGARKKNRHPTIFYNPLYKYFRDLDKGVLYEKRSKNTYIKIYK